MMMATMLLSVNALVGPSVMTPTSTKTAATSPSRLCAATADMMLPEGMLKTITQPGTGRRVTLGDTARVNYSCYLVSDDDKQQSSSSALPDGMPFSKGNGVRMVNDFILCFHF